MKANTAKKAMEAVSFLLAWSIENAQDLPLQLASGQPMALTQCLAFTAWLKLRSGIGYSAIPSEVASTYNSTVASVRRFIEWTILAAHTPHQDAAADNSTRLVATLKLHELTWKQIKPLPVSKPRIAQDLEDDDIQTIETYLRHSAEMGLTDRRVAFRDYLMWRLAIEYGLRIGEILALRLEDLPSLTRDYLAIVRTDHRGGLIDPRGSGAPKVKTLGRELGYFFRNTRFPELFSNYQASHRWVWCRRKTGTRYQRTRFPHPYLLLNTTNGAPLSMPSAEARAAAIKEETGIDFHWHKARHAFFNRAYVAVEAINDTREREERRAGLVYWGGWSSDESLDIYTRTARRNKARRGAFELLGSHDNPHWDLLQ